MSWGEGESVFEILCILSILCVNSFEVCSAGLVSTGFNGATFDRSLTRFCHSCPQFLWVSTSGKAVRNYCLRDQYAQKPEHVPRR
jgi:hypothetical protein